MTTDGSIATLLGSRLCACLHVPRDKVQNQNRDQAQFTIKKTTALKKLIDAYHRRMGAVPNTYRLLFEGNRINDRDTAESLEIEDMNVIDAFVVTVGGSQL